MAWTKVIPAHPVVAVAGATGAVGNEFLKVLHDLDFPASEVRAASRLRARLARSFPSRVAATFPQASSLCRK